MEKLSPKIREMLSLAEAARERCYAPYSKKSVGACILTESGECFVGANIENASFSATVCAERVALYRAVMAGERKFSAIAISGGDLGAPASDGFFPCGVCLQTLSEFATGELSVFVNRKEYKLSELLPLRFKF